MVDVPRKGGCRKPGAAAEIDGALEEGGLLFGRSHRQHRLEQQLRRAIVEIAEQHRLEARGILVEQRLHIAPRHLGQWRGAEPHQPDGRAVAIVGIGRARFTECRDRRGALAELLADFAEREPGRGKVRRDFDRLLQEIGGRRQIAFQLQVARELEAAVGKQIA